MSVVQTSNLIPYAQINKKQSDYIIRSQVAWLNVLGRRQAVE